MKNSKLLSIICFLCLCAIFSCEEDSELVPQQENAGEMLQLKMRLNASTEDFEGASAPSSRATSYVWQDEDVLYLNFFQNGDTLRGSAVYDSSSEDWTVSVPGNLERGASGKVEVMFFKSLPLTNSNIVSFSSYIPVYQDTKGHYEYDFKGKEMMVEAMLRPLTSRIRFQGEVGDVVSLGDVEHFILYYRHKGLLIKDNGRIKCKIGESGLTPYIYVLRKESTLFPKLVISRHVDDHIEEYSMDCGSSMLAIGKSGRMHLPTAESHEGWTMETIPLWVDLGLSVKWASCNVGATAPDEYGDYFAWGETQPKSEYNEENSLTYGKQMNDISGNSKYDAATANWGAPARMPTHSEIEELYYHTTQEWTTCNGVKGCLLTSKNNGNRIFLPATAYISGTFAYVGSRGDYWSSTPYDDDNAHFIYSATEWFGRGWEYRYVGRSVRPVCSNENQPVTPTATTGEASNILTDAADVSVSFSNVNRGATYGVEYSVVGQEKVSKKILDVAKDGSYTVSLKYLEPNTTYTYRAFVSGYIEPIYGESKQFTTKQTVDSELWVDLGLPSGVLWASYNVGANAPEEYGAYFAWGETSPKSSYDASNSLTLNKPMTDISGNPQYDAATAKWGAPARMPKKAEIEELVLKCKTTWTIRNGVNGQLVTGPNGNCIFLPAAGFQNGTSLFYVGEYGSYWGSTPIEGDNDVCNLNFDNRNFNWKWGGRDGGLSVRPVRNK